MIALNLPISDGYGWGVCGQNIAAALSEITSIDLFPQPLLDCAHPLKRFQNKNWDTEHPIMVDYPCFHAIEGASFKPFSMNVWSRTKNIGYCFIEENSKAKAFVPNAKRYYDHVFAGSTWATGRLWEIGVTNASTLLQGVDHKVFNTESEVRPPSDRFTIFSGGKWEYRKGQDIVLKAFKHMAEKYYREKEVHLVAAWDNPWINTMRSMARSPHILAPNFGGTCNEILRAIMTVNEVPQERVHLVEHKTNAEMANIYRSCDVSLFPNRCEAGTNMVMMESMACGLPAITHQHNGHWDIIALDECRAFEIDGEVVGQDGWLEPNLDVVIDAVENAYSHRSELPSRGKLDSNIIKHFTWAETAKVIMGAL